VHILSKKRFKDGSILEWADRESLRYTKGDFITYIWVEPDGPGIFSAPRVIRSYELNRWDEYPDGASEIIEEDKKRDIIDKVKSYYLRCRDETLEEKLDRDNRVAKFQAGKETVPFDKKVLEDGSIIEPDDRRGRIKYTEGSYSTSIKIDIRNHLLKKNEWILISSSIIKWKTRPQGAQEMINKEKKQEIIEKVKMCYREMLPGKIILKIE